MKGLSEFLKATASGGLFVLLPVLLLYLLLAGRIKIVKKSQVEILDVNLSEFTRVISQWGVGSSDILVKRG